MRIVCPSCRAAYEVPEKLLAGPPRRVRCARCGGQWFPGPGTTADGERATPPAPPGPPIPAPSSSPAGATEPEAPRAEPGVPRAAARRDGAPARRDGAQVLRARSPAIGRAEEKPVAAPPDEPGRDPLVLVAGIAWAASLALLGALGWAAVAFRQDVMALWEPSRRLYALLGLG